eukprot:7545116-Pyramimonas_sp.AAC.1
MDILLTTRGEQFLLRGGGAYDVHYKRRRDASALDCRIRAAVQAGDLVGEWARNLGGQVRADIRRQGSLLQEAIYRLQH